MLTEPEYDRKDSKGRSRTKLPAILLNHDFYQKPRNQKWIESNGYEAVTILQIVWIACSQEKNCLLKKEDVFYIPTLKAFTKEKINEVVSSAIEVGLLEAKEDYYFNSQILSDHLSYKNKKENNALRQEKYRNKKTLRNRDVTRYETVLPVNVSVSDIDLNNINNNLKNSQTEKLKLKKEKPEKETHGHYQRVRLTNAEYQSLINELGSDITEALIVELDGYIESTGRSYKSHAATILNWHRRNQHTPRVGKQIKDTSAGWGKIFEEVVTK